MLLLNLFLAGVLVVITFAVHFAGLVGLSWMLRHRFLPKTKDGGDRFAKGLSVLIIVLGLFALHSVQIWIYAVVYLVLGEFNSVETALYFSTSTFTTVGFGDLVLDENWRMLAAAESANGFLLIGWSTAFLVSVTARVRILEAEFEDSFEPSATDSANKSD